MKKNFLLPLDLQMHSEEPKDKTPEELEQERLEQERLEQENKDKEEQENKDKEPENQPKPSNSATSSASVAEVEHLTNLVKLHGETTKMTHEVITQLREELRETQAELQTTTELLQSLISQMDEHSEKLILSTASLVKLHEAQSKKEG